MRMVRQKRRHGARENCIRKAAMVQSYFLCTAVLLHCAVQVFGYTPLPSGRGRSSKREIAASRAWVSAPVKENASSEDKDDREEDEDETSIRGTLRRLAELSLEDYKWRSAVFKSNEAERMMEESLARMRGSDASYVRPMDADDTKIGPLGRWEKSAVAWLSQVIDEEGRRAEKIVSSDGRLVRPKDASDDGELGPLGFLEKQFVDFLSLIRSSERERAEKKILRPKDVDESNMGPLGQAELAVVRFFDDIRQSEKLRMMQSRMRGGEIVRPIDVPGPLGDFELAVTDFIKAEQSRAKERDLNQGEIVRPKDARRRGPLGEAELQAFETIKKLSREEKERMRNMERFMREKRPMENDSNSFLGVLETIVVGVLRAPQMVMSVYARVEELLNSSSLERQDSDMLRSQQKDDSPDRTKP